MDDVIIQDKRCTRMYLHLDNSAIRNKNYYIELQIMELNDIELNDIELNYIDLNNIDLFDITYSNTK